MFKELTNSFFNNGFKITLFENKLYISNYNKLLIFDDNEILLEIKEGFLKIKGINLSITRFENNDMCIEGIIKNINLE